MKRGMRDGLVKSMKDGLNPPFEQLYFDSWVTVDYFRWKKQGGNTPQKINFLRKVVVRKVISELVKIETNNALKDKYGLILQESDWKLFCEDLGVTDIGNPLNLSPITSDDFDDAHIKIAKSLKKCVIVTWDSDFCEKAPDVAWKYGKIRQVHSDT